MPNAYEDEEQQELSFIAGWNAKWYSLSERQSVHSCKTNHMFTVISSNRAPWYLSKEAETMSTLKHASWCF